MARKNVSLVVGVNGLPGAAIMERLVNDREPVRALARKDEAPETVPDGVEFAAADLSDAGALAGVLAGVKTVYNAACHDKRQELGVPHLRRLCAAALEAGVRRFVHISAAGVYGAEPLETPCREETGLNPSTDHERFLVQAETVVRESMQQGLKAVVLRPIHVYGPGTGDGVNRLICAISTGLVAFIPREAQKHSSHFIHAGDLARAAVFLAGQRKALGETYNVADDVVRSFAEVVNRISDITGSPPPPFRPAGDFIKRTNKLFERIADAAGVKPFLDEETIDFMTRTAILDNFKLKSLGFRFEWPDSAEGFKQTVEWLRKRGWLRNPLRLITAD